MTILGKRSQSLLFSISFILSIASKTYAFVTNHAHGPVQLNHLIQHPQQTKYPHVHISSQLQVPWAKRSFSRNYGTESDLPDEDYGVIVPQDGFGSPCVIKVSQVKLMQPTMITFGSLLNATHYKAQLCIDQRYL